MKKRTMALLAAVLLIVGGIIGGTLAWLTAKTTPVVNTFTTSDINITLAETTGSTYKMIPGWTINKDPKATVLTGSEDCYLFVKLDKTANFDTYMTCQVADDWTALTGVSDVYYRVVTAAEMGTAYSVLKDDTVTVLGTVTKEMMNSLTADNYPKLTVTAYASQLYKNNTEKFTAAEAWENISQQ